MTRRWAQPTRYTLRRITAIMKDLTDLIRFGIFLLFESFALFAGKVCENNLPVSDASKQLRFDHVLYEECFG